MIMLILLNILRVYLPPEEETNAMQEPMEEEIAETKIPLGEKKEESEEQKKDLPSNGSNSYFV